MGGFAAIKMNVLDGARCCFLTSAASTSARKGCCRNNGERISREVDVTSSAGRGERKREARTAEQIWVVLPDQRCLRWSVVSGVTRPRFARPALEPCRANRSARQIKFRQERVPYSILSNRRDVILLRDATSRTKLVYWSLSLCILT